MKFNWGCKIFRNFETKKKEEERSGRQKSWGREKEIWVKIKIYALFFLRVLH